jgi:Ca-activated chloride channel family protein
MALVPVGRNANGSLRYEYQPVEIDEALLTNIARMTGGRYFRARDAAALQNIYAQINQLERAPVHSSTIVRYRELYRWPLAIGILALFAELGIVAWKAPLP